MIGVPFNPIMGQELRLDLAQLIGPTSSIPPEITNLKSLVAIFLSVNQLTEVPEGLLAITSLQSLHLTRNQIAALPDAIGRLSNLSRLDLDGNFLTQLPEGIGELKQLTRLDLDGNRIKVLPPGIGELEHIASIQLTRNSLEEFPTPLLSLRSLQDLTLGHNAIAELPRAISALSSLERLDLSFNRLDDLPKELAELAKVTSVASRASDPRTPGLLIQGNPLPEELLQAADEGVASLWAYLRDGSREERRDPETKSTSASNPEQSAFKSFVGPLEFNDFIGEREGIDLRRQIEALLAWASEAIETGAFAQDPVLESRVVDDRNLLQRELTRSPTIDVSVAIPHIQRLATALLDTVSDDVPRLDTARQLVSVHDPNPRDPGQAIARGEIISDALEDSGLSVPEGFVSWQQWLAIKLGWLRQLNRTDLGLGGGAMVTASEIATMLGVTGPVGVVVGVVAATLAVAFRPRGP